jgi:L-alanine-DL-glutamate epimerase-like enolase superfamily enzyme
MAVHASLESLRASAYVIPTDGPEEDGTYRWESTTLVLVEVGAGGRIGIGYSYSHAAIAQLINDSLQPLLLGTDVFASGAAWQAMLWSVRNLGRSGLCATAIAAVDAALWDLKGRLLGVPVVALLGQTRLEVPVYGSGGFTSYTQARLREQLGGWARQGIRWVKMKVGARPHEDYARVQDAREAIGEVGLFVDANGAYSRKEALEFAERFA